METRETLAYEPTVRRRPGDVKRRAERCVLRGIVAGAAFARREDLAYMPSRDTGERARGDAF